METDTNELKHRNNNNNSSKTADSKKTTESESESESGQSKQNSSKNDDLTASTATATTATTNVPTVIRTKEEYFDALRVWLQQVQLQQMAYAYFPYYLSANLPPNMNNVFNTSMPFPTPPPQAAAAAAAAAQFPAFPPAPMGINGQPGGGFNFANAGNDALNRAGGPFIGNSIFQNRNQYMENMRQNMQILYQNGGYEYVIAPIWKRVLAEAIDVRPTTTRT